MTDELHNQQRGATVRGVVIAVDDSGPVQTIDVMTHGGVIRTGVEVHHPYGLISCAPGKGAIVTLHAVGGDQGDMMASPPAHPSSRFAAKQGEVGLADSKGNRVHIKQGGVIDVVAATQINAKVGDAAIVVKNGAITLTVGGTTLTIADGAVSITGGSFTTDHDVSDKTGSMQKMRNTYNAHSHSNNGASPPTGQMS